MSYEDLVTIKVFLMALENLEQPLPEDIRLDLGIISEDLPGSAYELHDLAERYEPLNQEYLSLLNDFPGEGERLKFSPSEDVKSKNHDQKDVELSEAEILIQQLQRQIANTPIGLRVMQSIDEFSLTALERHGATIGVRSRYPSPIQTRIKTSSSPHLIQDLGWTQEEATAIRYRFAAFREDWEAPGMELYDDL